MSKVKVEFDWIWVHNAVEYIDKKLRGVKYITGIPRGGIIPAIMLSHYSGIPYIPYSDINLKLLLPDVKHSNIVILDDIADTGYTLANLDPRFTLVSLVFNTRSIVEPNIYYYTNFNENNWIIFPWERKDSITVADYLK